MRNEKAVFIIIAAVILAFLSGFFARDISDRKRISNAAEYREAVESEFGRAENAHSGIESGITGARSGVERSLEQSGIIGSGLEGIERLAVENTGLLGEAEQILLDAGERKRGAKAE
jgi:hypothetical protein